MRVLMCGCDGCRIPTGPMLAICSDLDETPDWSVYWEIMQFLTSLEENSPMVMSASNFKNFCEGNQSRIV